EQMLGCSEGLLHSPQLLVAEHGFERVEIGVGTQHEDAVELLLLLDLIAIDREVIFADCLQVTPITGVAHQRLVALGEPPLKSGEDRISIGSILLRLLMVAADNVAPPGQHHRLVLALRLLPPPPPPPPPHRPP